MVHSMSVPMHIDAMREDDVDAVAAMDGPTAMTAEHLRDELLRPWSRLWVAREEGTGGGIVAFLVCWHVSDELHVLNVATRLDRRRLGIGRALMNEAVGYGRKHRVRHVLLEVRRTNRAAIAMYRALGFFAMGVRAKYYPDDEDAVEMVLKLDPNTGDVVPHTDEVRLDS
jgi:ribosomal-protein-alanine N-acetyltransferase